MLKKTFINLLSSYTLDHALIESLWNNLEKHYSNPERHYHNLIHLNDLLQQLHEVKHLIDDWQIVLFTLYFHDIIYDVKSKTNEEDSADYAEKVMTALQIPARQIEKCRAQIIATKLHDEQSDIDTNLFTDADLSILGANQSRYAAYADQIRQEYAIYPDDLCVPGRKHVLKHFLQMERIFKTKYFYDKYESQAKSNLLKELHSL